LPRLKTVWLEINKKCSVHELRELLLTQHRYDLPPNFTIEWDGNILRDQFPLKYYKNLKEGCKVIVRPCTGTPEVTQYSAILESNPLPPWVRRPEGTEVEPPRIPENAERQDTRVEHPKPKSPEKKPTAYRSKRGSPAKSTTQHVQQQPSFDAYNGMPTPWWVHTPPDQAIQQFFAAFSQLYPFLAGMSYSLGTPFAPPHGAPVNYQYPPSFYTGYNGAPSYNNLGTFPINQHAVSTSAAYYGTFGEPSRFASEYNPQNGYEEQREYEEQHSEYEEDRYAEEQDESSPLDLDTPTQIIANSMECTEAEDPDKVQVAPQEDAVCFVESAGNEGSEISHKVEGLQKEIDEVIQRIVII